MLGLRRGLVWESTQTKSQYRRKNYLSVSVLGTLSAQVQGQRNIAIWYCFVFDFAGNGDKQLRQKRWAIWMISVVKYELGTRKRAERKGWRMEVHMMCAQRRAGVLRRSRSVWFDYSVP